MVELIADPWFDSARAEGQKEGMAKGMAEGVAKGKAEVLTKQLRLKFGRLPKGSKALIAQASVEEIDAWVGAVINAKVPSDIFGERLQH